MEGGSKSSPEPDGLPQRINRETKYSQTIGENSTAAMAIVACEFCSVSFSERTKK